MTREEAEKEIRTRVSHKRTICEVWREIWDIVDLIEHPVMKAELKSKIIDGFIMGKKMNAKLVEYKKDWDKGVFEPNPDFKADVSIRSFRNGGYDVGCIDDRGNGLGEHRL